MDLLTVLVLRKLSRWIETSSVDLFSLCYLLFKYFSFLVACFRQLHFLDIDEEESAGRHTQASYYKGDNSVLPDSISHELKYQYTHSQHYEVWYECERVSQIVKFILN